ncbi:response regulator [Magnetospira sp. QH-2]|uniref:response regulator n=1 Tax=Magnetospira sp. (strain QH-2) TaxID=1288970 RepID=UPI0003E81B86|nr:response regulator [Magnetospira sp. QH-2]CCQ75407.1 putative CheY-like response regulator receiver domain protein [Magnetospira sp. QH-2]
MEFDLSQVSIMIVDDNSHMLSLYKTLLRTFRCRKIHQANNGAQAYSRMKDLTAPDILITNWYMPVLDGVELTRAIRTMADSPNPFLPIIMISGFAEEEHITAARDAGVNEFLVKPISAKVFCSRLNNVIRAPRPFVRTQAFFGPDRRRKASILYTGPERRSFELEVPGFEDL